MWFVSTQPELLTAAAGDLQGIGAAVGAGNAAAALSASDVANAAAAH